MVVTHKPDKIYSDTIYTPIHVGKANSRYNLGYLGDDTGDNISWKNPCYCELTAQYWAWKNLECNYIGLCHYRRYFKTVYDEKTLDNVFDKYDIILSSPVYLKFSLENKLARGLTLEDEALFLLVIKKIYPEYEASVLKYLKGNMDIPYNMFITTKHHFDIYAKWEFTILEECEKLMRISNYSRLKRIFGYLGEYLLPIYCIHNNLKIKFEDVVDLEGRTIYKKGQMIKKLFVPLYLKCFPRYNRIEDLIPAEIRTSLRNDYNIVVV